MSDTALPHVLHRLWNTPLRDMLRLRLSGRLDWRARLAAAELPGPARAMIERVVRRTRLWREEKCAVVDELAAHFRDATASGEPVEAAIAAFGDPTRAAKLIRKAKIRNRPKFRRVAISAALLSSLAFVALIALWASLPEDGVVPVLGPSRFHPRFLLLTYILTVSGHGFELTVLHFTRSPQGPVAVYYMPGIDIVVNFAHLHGTGKSFAMEVSFPFLLVPTGGALLLALVLLQIKKFRGHSNLVTLCPPPPKRNTRETS